MDPELSRLAEDLRACLGTLVRRLRKVHVDGEVTLPESSALAQLERQGPLASGALAQLEQISAQSMGTTLSALQARGLVQRAADPGDGRRVVVSLTAEGREAMLGLRRERAEWLADALANGFTPLERAQLSAAIPLLDRLARTN